MRVIKLWKRNRHFPKKREGRADREQGGSGLGNSPKHNTKPLQTPPSPRLRYSLFSEGHGQPSTDPQRNPLERRGEANPEELQGLAQKSLGSDKVR